MSAVPDPRSTAASDGDRIVRSVTIRAPRERVWRALSDPAEFGAWFGVALAGQRFEPGARVRGAFTHTGCENLWFSAVIERMEPTRLFSYRWHPYAVDASADYTAEEPTLVTFTLEEAPGPATLLTVVESGFDRVPPERRVEAFRMNTRGWEMQLENVVRHVEAGA